MLAGLCSSSCMRLLACDGLCTIEFGLHIAVDGETGSGLQFETGVLKGAVHAQNRSSVGRIKHAKQFMCAKQDMYTRAAIHLENPRTAKYRPTRCLAINKHGQAIVLAKFEVLLWCE